MRFSHRFDFSSSPFPSFSFDPICPPTTPTIDHTTTQYLDSITFVPTSVQDSNTLNSPSTRHLSLCLHNYKSIHRLRCAFAPLPPSEAELLYTNEKGSYFDPQVMILPLTAIIRYIIDYYIEKDCLRSLKPVVIYQEDVINDMLKEHRVLSHLPRITKQV